MKGKIIKFISILMSISVAFSVVGCGGKEHSATVDTNYEWLQNTYSDSSELTSWSDLGQTKKLNLVAWNTLQQGGFKKVNASNDVVSPEISRITGVSINKNKSFDNGGVSADVAFNSFYITGLPDIAYGQWVDPEEVYDLTELIDEYCPTIKARMPKSVWSAQNINGGKKGKVYAVPYGLGDVGLSDVDPTAPQDTCLMFNSTTNYYPYIYVREDILLDAYPNAYSTAQLQQIYDNNGKFTEEELFDVEITSANQFRTEFLPKIYNAIHADTKYKINAERWVEVMPCGYGSDGDTWDFMGMLIPYLIGATGNYLNTMHTYWDAIDQEIKLLMTQDFYKAELSEWIELIEEGKYLDDYAILNNKQTIKSEMNRGYYAIAYGSSTKPDGDIATLDGGEKVEYRRVYLKIEKNEHFEFFNIAEPSVNGVCIFKDSVSEGDLPQILRWLDFQCSTLCDKLVAWGPESAGLFEIKDGVRQFKDNDLVNQMVYSTVVLGEKAQKYNLHNGTADPANRAFTFFYQGGSKEHPKTVYDLSDMAGMLYTAYSPAAVLPNIKPIGIAQRPDIWTWTNNELNGVESVWGKRPGIERKLFEVLRSGNITSKWSELEQLLSVSGWTNKYFTEDFTEAFLNLNEAYLDKFYKG